jgi:hypothetical protein
MDRTLIAVRKMLRALDAPAYDVGVLGARGMLPGLACLSGAQVLARLPLLKSHNARGAHIYVRPAGEHRFTVLDDLSLDSVRRLKSDGYEPCAVVETSTGNFQAWLKHDDVYPARLSTFIAQGLAARYHGDPNAADWRRFGRLPGFTNCKPKYRRPDGLFPFVLLREATGQQYGRAAFLRLEMTRQFQLREQERERRIAQYREALRLHPNGSRASRLSLARFRASPKYAGRPAAADLAFCVAACSLAVPESAMADALASDYLSRDPDPQRKAAYIERTLAKARTWAQR